MYNFCGSSLDKRPSREEMQKVVRHQGDTVITESADRATDKQMNMIRAVCKSMSVPVPSGLQGFTKREASQYIDQLKNPQPNDERMAVDDEPF
jgi:hypothetical protein